MRTQNTKATQMRFSRAILIPVVMAAGGALSATACAQIAVPRTAATAGRVLSPQDSVMRGSMAPSVAADAPVTLYADLGARLITVQAGDQNVKTFAVSVGQ